MKKELAGKVILVVVAILFVFLSSANQYRLAQNEVFLARELTNTQTKIGSLKSELLAVGEKITNAKSELEDSLKELLSAQTEFSVSLADLKEDLESRAKKEDLGKMETNLKSALTTEVGNLEKTAAANIAANKQESKQDLAIIENKIFQPDKIFEKTRKAIVSISTDKSSGSGFLFGNNNLVVTAYHVIQDANGPITIIPNDEFHLFIMGNIKQVMPEWDLAIIELVEPLKAEPLKAASAGKLAVGDQVIAIGNPAHMNNSVSAGVISGLDRKINGLPLRFIQIDASIYFGNSGGPILNRNGEVIGVTSKTLSTSFNFSLAVPIDYAGKLLEK